jgi:hypothetical protein
MTTTTTDKDLIAFKALSSFVDELSELFEKKHHPLKLYKRLISKTTLSHETAILKHIDAFRTFCLENRETIKTRKVDNIKGTIQYSSRVYIDLAEIFKYCKDDNETLDAIWNHILTISAIVDPENNAKEILKKRMKKPQSNRGNAGAGGAANLISSLMSSMESQVNNSQLLEESQGDPSKLISGIMSSGIFQNLLSNVTKSLNDENMDINSLVGVAQSMLSNMNNQDGSQQVDISSMMTQIMGSLSAVAPPPPQSEHVELTNTTSPSSTTIPPPTPLLSNTTEESLE